MDVSVVEEYKGQHKSICVCHQGCAYFKPGDTLNCKFAQAAYELSKTVGIALVMECKYYAPE
jgi:hypothetical protein